MRKVTITTVDNPYDPEKEFSDWYKYDEAHMYGTSEHLANLVGNIDNLPDDEYWKTVEEAIDFMIEHQHMYRKENFYKKIVFEE